MARTIAEIQAQIITAVQNDGTLGPQLTSTSVTAIWRLWTYIVATAIFLHESLWDAFRAEITELVATEKPHTLRWYQQKALAFQLGGTLLPADDEYDNTGLTDDEIAAQKIVAQAAAVEQSNILIVKAAKESAGILVPLSVPETTALDAYFQDIKDAGVNLLVRSVNPDRLRVEAEIYYDPAILDSNGARLDGSNSTPVQDAVYAFLRELPFDGRFVKAHLTDKMQAVEGVVIPEIRICEARRDDDPSFGSVDVMYNPYAGYLQIYVPDDDLVLTFISY